MKRSDISEFLKGELVPEEFQSKYAAELDKHLKLLSKRGASAPVCVTGDQYIFVSRVSFRRVLQAFVVGTLRKEMLVYLLDVLTLDAKSIFADQAIKEMAMNLVDENFNEKDVEEVLAKV